jgi:hypothetical protein
MLVVLVTTIGFMPILQVFFMAVRCQMPESTMSTTNSGVLDLADMRLTYFQEKACFSSSHAIVYSVSIIIIIIHCLAALASNLMVFDDTPFYRSDEYWNPFAKINGTMYSLGLPRSNSFRKIRYCVHNSKNLAFDHLRFFWAGY